MNSSALYDAVIIVISLFSLNYPILLFLGLLIISVFLSFNIFSALVIKSLFNIITSIHLFIFILKNFINNSFVCFDVFIFKIFFYKFIILFLIVLFYLFNIFYFIIFSALLIKSLFNIITPIHLFIFMLKNFINNSFGCLAVFIFTIFFYKLIILFSIV